MKKVREWDAIGLERGIHITCSAGYKRRGSERFACRPDGSWRTELSCTMKRKITSQADFANNILQHIKPM